MNNANGDLSQQNSQAKAGMEAIMKLASMWYAINSADIEVSQKKVLFVGINVFMWAAIAFTLCLIEGAVCGNFSENWGFMTFLVTGYSAVIMGFFRSVFYLLRK